MKRDMELIRKLAFALESQESVTGEQIEIDGYIQSQIGHHIWLMLDSGLVHGEDTTTRGSDSPEASAICLTWSGHEFADAVRSDTLWHKATSTVKRTVGSVSIAVFTQYLQSLTKTALGIG